jgi:predicted membrane-bound spermidine synthase
LAGRDLVEGRQHVAEGRLRSNTLRFAGVYAFVGSACLLVLEIVAARILAPALGASLYTWTSVIGVVLAGISLGNWVGGWLADRRSSRSTLSTLYLISASLCALVLVLARDVEALVAPSSWPAMLQVLWLAALMFLLPSVALGTVTPLLVKLSLRSLEQTGRVVGRIQAAAALGSIAGTFATGFLLVSWLGTRTIVAGVAGTLLLLAVASSPGWTKLRTLSVSLVAVAVAAALALGSQDTCLEESDYYCIRVLPVEVKGTAELAPGVRAAVSKVSPGEDRVRALKLDHLVHGLVDLDQPTRLLYPYERVHAEVVGAAHRRGSQLDAFLLGGGAYTFPRHLEERYRARIVVAEIDPAVTEVARKHLGLRDSRHMEIVHEDARVALRGRPAHERFDLIVGDAFNDLSVPQHLTTREFNALVARHLRPHGMYLVNVIDAAEHDFLRSYVKTLQRSFPHVRLVTPPRGWPLPSTRSTVAVVASAAPLPEVAGMVPAGELRKFMRSGSATVLTDDHAPVDQLLAPVFGQRLKG